LGVLDAVTSMGLSAFFGALQRSALAASLAKARCLKEKVALAGASGTVHSSALMV
jgi:hypothetical protein